MKIFTGKREFLSTARGGSCDGTTARTYTSHNVSARCVVYGAWAHGFSQLTAGWTHGSSQLAARSSHVRASGSLTTPPTAAVLRVRCLHSRLCCSRDLAIYRETFSDSPAALENPFEPLDHLEEESGCDFVAVYIVFVLQDRCRREREDSALVRSTTSSARMLLLK